MYIQSYVGLGIYLYVNVFIFPVKSSIFSLTLMFHIPFFSILLHSDNVSMDFSGQDNPIFKGSKNGRIYLTSHRMIFNSKKPNDQMQSFSAPFIAMTDVSKTNDAVYQFFTIAYDTVYHLIFIPTLCLRFSLRALL